MTYTISRKAHYAIGSALVGLIGLGAVGCKDGSVGDLILDHPKQAISNADFSGIPDAAVGGYVDMTRLNPQDLGHEVARTDVRFPNTGSASQWSHNNVADKTVSEARSTARRCIDNPKRCGVVIKGNR